MVNTKLTITNYEKWLTDEKVHATRGRDQHQNTFKIIMVKTLKNTDWKNLKLFVN